MSWIKKFYGLSAVLIILLAFVPISYAAGPGVGPDCDFPWTDPNNDPLNINGYNVRWGTSPGLYPNVVDVGKVFTATCSTLGITVFGQYHAVIVAYNATGEGPASADSPFVLQVAPPSAAPMPGAVTSR